MAGLELAILIKARDAASKVMQRTGLNSEKMGAAVKKAAIVGGVAIAGLALAAGKMAVDFESSMAEVKTLLPDLDKEGFAKLTAATLEFSKQTGVATKEAVPALYQAISAGVPQENVFEFMRIASEAAVGGVTDLETAVDGISSVVNAYGSEVINAQKASDIMFTAVKLGKTDFNQLSNSLFNVIPTASSLGVAFEDVAAQLAVMTAQGVPTKIATTQIRAAFVELSKSGSVLSTFISENLGTSFKQLIADGMSTSEVFNLVKKAAEDQGIEFNSLFGSVEAYSAALAITGRNSEKAAEALAAMQGSAGATNKAFETIADTVKFKVEKKINEFKVTLTSVGGKMITVAPALAAIGPAMAIAAAAMPAMGAGLGILSTGFGVMGVAARIAWTAATGPVGLVILGITAAIAIGVLLWKNWDTIKAKALEVFSFIKDIFNSKWAWLLPGGVLIKAILFLKDNWRAIWDSIVGTTERVWDTITSIGKTGMNAFIGFINGIIVAWNSLEFKIPEIKLPFGKTFGGFSIGTPDIPLIPTFARGGIVPGPLGSPQLAIVHGGERVLPAGRSSAAGVTLIFQFNAPVYGVDDMRDLINRTVRDTAVAGGFHGIFQPAT